MHKIEIDDDIYLYLLSKVLEIGESASSILRRELKLGHSEKTTDERRNGPGHELSVFLASPSIRFGTATDKYLAVLGEAHKQKPKEFEKILSLRGRDRVYFARTKEEIVRSGKSTQPLQIPGTQFWAMTNSPTPQKKQLLQQALELMGYSTAARFEAAKIL